MNKAKIIGWIIELLGTALWVYGFYTVGTPPVFDWPAYTPWWMSEYLPNIQSEAGMLLVFTGMIPIYWPSKR